MGLMNPMKKNFEPCPQLGFKYVQIYLMDIGHPKETVAQRESKHLKRNHKWGRERPVSAELWRSEGIEEWS